MSAAGRKGGKLKTETKKAEPVDVAALIARSRENPFGFLSLDEVRRIFGFGVNTMTELVRMGAPVVARKMNPGMLMEWLRVNASEVGKIREE